MLIIYREKKELQNQELLVLERNEINHIKALRLKDDDEILVSDGEGKAYKSKLKYPDKLIINYKEIILEQKKQNVTICSAIPSGNRLEKMIDMAVQLGITNYIPVIYRYSERKDFSIERIKKIIRQASSQCGRLTLANIYAPIRFQDIFQYYKHKIMLFADKNPEHKISFNELVQISKRK
ncbi:MAG: hypothetical protein KatS3mg129_0277 [Leptospiraceae bacterium]|nr:MAG: hypothetical protein KatS3mg129_0277 [Leptospiraceae bacterium]